VIPEIQSTVGFAKSLPRYHAIIGILFKYGFADVLKLVALQQVLGLEKTELQKHETGILSKPPQERLRLALEELGPTFIKFGQILSSRRDLIPAEYYAELRQLQDEVPPFDGELAKQIFLEEIGIRAEEAFAEFDGKPIAGASIAQVHRAVTRQGETVAVKIQRPDIRPMIEQDLVILMDLARFTEACVPALSSLNPVATVREFAASLSHELDFSHEAENSERFARQFVGNPWIKVPRLFPDLSKSRVLTMEFISGHSVNDVETMRNEGVDPVALSERISVLIFEQVMVHGFFHGDPHPGNMTLLPGGILGLYDFGMMGELSTSFRASIANLLAGLSSADHRQVMNALLEMSEEGSVGDPDAMLRGIESFSTRHLAESISKVRLTVVFNALLELLQEHHLRMKGAFYLGIKALTQIEAVGLELNPALNFVEIGRPYAEKIILSRYTPGHITEILKRLATESVGFLEVLPDDFHRFWIRLRKGEVSIPIEHKIDPKGFEPIRTTVDSVANRLANSILAASVLICSSIIIHSRIPPRIWDIPILGLIGLICGALMTFRLVMSIWKHGGL